MLFCGLLIWIPLALAITDVDRRYLATATDVGVHIANVPPSGWRRTVSGWERAERWAKPAVGASLGIQHWLTIQDQRESSLARDMLGHLRALHPLFISVTLLAAVVLIVLLDDHMTRGSNSAVHSSQILLDGRVVLDLARQHQDESSCVRRDQVAIIIDRIS